MICKSSKIIWKTKQTVLFHKINPDHINMLVLHMFRVQTDTPPPQPPQPGSFSADYPAQTMDSLTVRVTSALSGVADLLFGGGGGENKGLSTSCAAARLCAEASLKRTHCHNTTRGASHAPIHLGVISSESTVWIASACQGTQIENAVWGRMLIKKVKSQIRSGRHLCLFVSPAYLCKL